MHKNTTHSLKQNAIYAINEHIGEYPQYNKTKPFTSKRIIKATICLHLAADRIKIVRSHLL